jgi:hypothetical protein
MVNRVILASLLLLLVPLWATAFTVTLPKTGQTLCYDAAGAIDCAGTGQDGETQIGAPLPVPRFTNNLNGTVTDNLTGLIWLQDALCPALNPPPANPSLNPQGGRDWASALVAANSLRSGQCGLSDGSVAGTWRLPNVNELDSLIDISQSYPPLPANHPFLNQPCPYPVYWTSTITGDYFPGINAIGADMYTGKIQGDDKTSPKYIWPVKGDSTTLAKTGQNTCWDSNGTVAPCNGSGTDGDLQKGVPLPNPRFFDNGNGTTTDSLTGLIWPRNVSCFTNISSQGQAIQAARTFASGACDLNDGSLPGDWRLPNRRELRSLVDFGRSWLAEFAGAPAHGWYWTSDSNPALPNTGDKWMVKSQGLAWLASELLTFQQLPPYFMLPVRGVLKIQRITFNAPASIRYGDPPLDLNAITTKGGSGNPLTFTLVSGPATLSGTTLTFTGGGSVVVKAAQAGNASYYPAADTLHTFAVSGASDTVVLTPADLVRTYDGTPKAVTATTSPAGLAVTFSYAGSGTPPTSAGSYLVTATISDPLHQGSVSGTLVIGKASGTVRLGNLNQTFDGSPKSATATTTPAGGSVVISYPGSSGAPTDAGSYPVLATISDPNFQTATDSGTLVIAKASCSVTLTNLTQTYDGTAKSPTTTTSPAGKAVTFSYTPANPVNAGSYALVATVSDANYSGTAIGTLTVTKKTPAVTWDTPAEISSGTALSAAQLNATGSVPGSFVYTPASGTVLPAGTQTLSALFTPSDTTNYASASVSVLLTVGPAPASTFLVTGSAPGGNGSITCTSPVSYGANCICTVTPDAGYHVFTLTDNNADRMSALSDGSYTIAGVTGNHVVSATFARPTGILAPATGKTKPDIGDALTVLKMVVKTTPCTAADIARADIAPLGSDGTPWGDGKLDIYDVIGILRMSIGH